MSKVSGFTWTVEDTNLITQDDVWGDVLVDLGRRDPRIVAVTADLGSSTKIGRFREAFPGRYFNVGICEQNLMAVAAGLAATGLVPVVSTYAVFASLRAAEFVRTDIAYNQRDVKIVGTLAGACFGQGGPTHHAIEDLALMRAIPGLTVMAPCDAAETAAALEAAIAWPGPVYLRIARGMEPLVHGPVGERPLVKVGEAIEVRAGRDVTVIACGPAVWHALSAAERAEKVGVSVRVVDMHTLKPLDEEAVRRAVTDTRRVITAEDHSTINGLGSAVADVIAAAGKACAFRKLGHPDRWAGMGIPDDLIHAAGFDDDGILGAIEAVMKITVPTDEDWTG